jgi:hypothetical protein
MRNWGATPDEIVGSVVGDHLCPRPRVMATRCVTIAAPPERVFPWIRQMGFGRAGWYSHDWIDNLGRRSATRIHDEWQDVVSGSPVPGGPIDFVAAIVEPPTAFVLQLGDGTRRLNFTLAYELREIHAGSHTRLVTRMRATVPGGRFFGGLIARGLLGPGDAVMVRKQLRTLASRLSPSDVLFNRDLTS